MACQIFFFQLQKDIHYDQGPYLGVIMPGRKEDNRLLNIDFLVSNTMPHLMDLRNKQYE